MRVRALRRVFCLSLQCLLWCSLCLLLLQGLELLRSFGDFVFERAKLKPAGCSLARPASCIFHMVEAGQALQSTASTKRQGVSTSSTRIAFFMQSATMQRRNGFFRGMQWHQ